MKRIIILFAIALLCEALQAQQLRTGEVLILPAANAQLKGGLAHHPYQNTDKDPKFFAVPGWKNKTQSFTWALNVEKKDFYQAAALIEIKNATEPIVLEISSGKHTSKVRLTTMEWNKVFFPDSLLLEAGGQQLHLRMISDTENPETEISIYSLELATGKTWAAKNAAAEKLRSKPSWLNEAAYGLFFHWNSRSQPRSGEAKSYAQAVKDFDVAAFANMVKNTGADFIVLTTSWAAPTFPAPLKTLDQIVPGNTTARDLIMDMANALNQHDIKLLVYCNFRMDWLGWKKNDSARTTFYLDNMIAIYREIGERYAHKIAGLWIDDGMAMYPYSAPFEAITTAVKQYDSDMVIGYNSWIYPRFTDFQDFFGGEYGITLRSAGVNNPHLPVGGDGYFISGPQQGLKATFCGLMERGDWTHTQPNEEIPPPLLSSDSLVKIVKEAVRRKNLPVMNVRIYQDGSISPHTYTLLKQLKEAILPTKH